MNEKIKHRGPDDEGIFVNPTQEVGLGHRRLSIIDLSPAGHQPMCNEDGTVWIVFNGEIYNFQSLRRELIQKGHRFRSNTDTETIVHLWEERQERCVQALRGMFAIAIWDERRRRLFLARDRAGKKPLKYFIGKNFLVFASELKAFLDEPGVPKTMDQEAIHHFLTFQYVPHPSTGFLHLHKLPPASTLSVDLSRPDPVILGPTPYWQLDFKEKWDFSLEEWKRRILQKLEEAVALRLISDVPLGAFLSGGVDSSAVVAMMAHQSSQPVKTFSIGFEHQTYNELPYARSIAERFQTDHLEFIIRPDAMRVLPDLVWHYEEPYADSSALPTWYLSEMTRRSVTVALNGDGGDENFAGYPTFPAHLFGSRVYSKIPRLLRQGVIRPLTKSLEQAFQTTFFHRGFRFNQSFELRPEARFLYYICYFSPELLRQLTTASFQSHSCIPPESVVELMMKENSTTHPLEQALAFNFRSYLADDLLPKVDIATMAFGLEARSPLLDQEFIELCAHMPPSLKANFFRKKWIFKKALEPHLPKKILYRKKQGFSIPLDEWFRGELKVFTQERLLSHDARIHAIFDRGQLQKFFDTYQRSRTNHGRLFWALLTLELWMERFGLRP